MPPQAWTEKLMKMEYTARWRRCRRAANMMSQLSAAQGINSQPFNEEARVGSLRDEFTSSASHSQIIKLGEQYGTFDPLGKIGYLDALEANEDWMGRLCGALELMGALNSDFREQTGDFLNSMGMSVGTLRRCCRRRDSMRRDAEAERAQIRRLGALVRLLENSHETRCLYTPPLALYLSGDSGFADCSSSVYVSGEIICAMSLSGCAGFSRTMRARAT